MGSGFAAVDCGGDSRGWQSCGMVSGSPGEAAGDGAPSLPVRHDQKLRMRFYAAILGAAVHVSRAIFISRPNSQTNLPYDVDEGRGWCGIVWKKDVEVIPVSARGWSWMELK